MLVIIDVPEEIKKEVQGSNFPESLDKYSDFMMERFIKSIVAKEVVTLFGKHRPKVVEWAQSLVATNDIERAKDIEIMQAALDHLKDLKNND